MSDNEDSVDNESFINTPDYLEMKQKITLSSSELIELTYHDQKFIAKLHELNHKAVAFIEDDLYHQAGLHLDEAERILEYAAGCGRTLERSVITTVLNNQACLLQRTSEFEQSANYLEAIIFNLSDFVREAPPPPHAPAQGSEEFEELATYLERKLSLALYHLRFCALTSHAKNNEAALKSARKAMELLKQLSDQEYRHLALPQYNVRDEEDVSLFKRLAQIKDLSSSEYSIDDVLGIALQNMKEYAIRLDTKVPPPELSAIFEDYSIGNLMQAGLLHLMPKPNHAEFMQKEGSEVGRLYRLVHSSMAHFTVATELRLISANKYALEEQQRHRSEEYTQSKMYHLASIILVARYLPCRSIFFDHAVNSFRNHYGIDLHQEALRYVQPPHLMDRSIIDQSPPRFEREENSPLREEQHEKTVEVHESKELVEIGSLNSLGTAGSDNSNKPTPPIIERPKNLDIKRIKSKNKLKISKINTETGKVIETDRRQPRSRNKENSSRNKVVSRSRDMLGSRNKQITSRHEEATKGIYYGQPAKSRSKSKKGLIQSKSKRLIHPAKSGLVGEAHRLRNDAKVEQEYGVKSAGTFHTQRPKDSKLTRRLKTSQASENVIEPVRTARSPAGCPIQQAIRFKKVRSPRGKERKKTVSKDKHLL